MDTQLPFTPDEIARLRALVKPAIVLLLMLRIDRPIGSREIADILGLDEHTAAKYLRSLSNLNLIARSGRKQGYILLGGRQLILGPDPPLREGPFREAPWFVPEHFAQEHFVPEHFVPEHEVLTVKKLQLKPTTTTTTIVESGGDEEVVVEESPHTVKNLQYAPEKRSRTVDFLQFEEEELSTAVDNFATAAGTESCPTAEHSAAHQALIEAGIGEPKRSSLAARPYMTPLYIKAWEMQLKKEKGERYSPGLLIHVLESGDPHPQVNELGHTLDCKCYECRQLGYMRCPYCRSYPCECDVDE